MKIASVISSARKGRDPQRLVEAIPYARFLGVRVEIRGEEFCCALPFRPDLIGNPQLPALHGGVTAGLLECAAILYLMWSTEVHAIPKTIDFSIDFLRTGRPQDTFATVHVVKPGRRVAAVRVEAWQENPEKPIATAHCNFLMG